MLRKPKRRMSLTTAHYAEDSEDLDALKGHPGEQVSPTPVAEEVGRLRRSREEPVQEVSHEDERHDRVDNGGDALGIGRRQRGDEDDHLKTVLRGGRPGGSPAFIQSLIDSPLFHRRGATRYGLACLGAAGVQFSLTSTSET